MSVHVGKLEFVLEIGNRTEPTDDRRRTTITGVVDGQAAERRHFNLRVIAEGLLRQFGALLGREQGTGLVGLLIDRNDNVVENVGGTPGYVDVAHRDRIEAAG